MPVPTRSIRLGQPQAMLFSQELMLAIVSIYFSLSLKKFYHSARDSLAMKNGRLTNYIYDNEKIILSFAEKRLCLPYGANMHKVPFRGIIFKRVAQ